MIPRLLHQIFIGPSAIPAREAKWCAAMEKMNRVGWTYKLHGNEALAHYDSDPFLRALLDQKQPYAFVADRLRVLILRDQGGTYLDSDCEPVQPLSTLDRVWDAKDITFATSARNPVRPRVAIRGGVSLVDNTFMASAPNSRMILLVESLWRAGASLVNGNLCGQRILAETDTDTAWLNWRYFYGDRVYPETVVLHDMHNAGSWVDPASKIVEKQQLATA